MRLPTFQAAITPNVTATVTAIAMVMSASESVGSMRWPISFRTGSLEKIEMPRSPPSTATSQRRNWVGSGSSSPRRCRIATICSGVALSPAMIAAGSPGERCNSRNTNTPTMPITSTVEPNRRAI